MRLERGNVAPTREGRGLLVGDVVSEQREWCSLLRANVAHQDQPHKCVATRRGLRCESSHTQQVAFHQREYCLSRHTRGHDLRLERPLHDGVATWCWYGWDQHVRALWLSWDWPGREHDADSNLHRLGRYVRGDLCHQHVITLDVESRRWSHFLKAECHHVGDASALELIRPHRERLAGLWKYDARAHSFTSEQKGRGAQRLARYCHYAHTQISEAGLLKSARHHHQLVPPRLWRHLALALAVAAPPEG